MQETAEQEARITVRGLKPDDLEAVIRLDAKNVGRRREEFFRAKLQQNLAESGIKVSLAAEIGGCFGGFLLARVYYGEFGAPEPVAVLDTIGVHPDFQGRGAGAALIRQLCTNLRGLGVSRLQTTVNWSDPRLLTFFHRQQFQPAPRFCLERDLAPQD